jgi:predicted ribosome quality control (RQC) complex YloA/Tae2 family protein
MQIGKNAGHNWKLIDSANPDDIWFHLKSFSSPHVISHANANLLECAIACKMNSRYKNWHNLKIIYTSCSNLIKGDAPGSVYFKSNRKVYEITV